MELLTHLDLLEGDAVAFDEVSGGAFAEGVAGGQRQVGDFQKAQQQGNLVDLFAGDQHITAAAAGGGIGPFALQGDAGGNQPADFLALGGNLLGGLAQVGAFSPQNPADNSPGRCRGI